MKITELKTERFGVWHELSLPLERDGLTVFYGPNEAGKTTLMRFLRSVLYGFDPRPGLDLAHGRRPRLEACAGRLRIEHDGESCEVRRVRNGDRPRWENEAPLRDRGEVTVAGRVRDVPADEMLRELLSGMEEDVFQRVFAVGLHEMQELATLHHDEVARHIYGMTLGPEGQRLLEATAAIDAERRRFFDAEGPSGELVELLHRERELTAELRSLEGLRERHAELCRDRERLDGEIGGLRSRRTNVQANLRGHLFLERVFGPWQQVREYEAELDRVPCVTGFPENGLQRLDGLETELETVTRCRDVLLAEAAQFRKEADALGVDPQAQQHLGTVQGFLDQRDWLTEVNEQADDAQARAQLQKEQLDARLAELGSDWSLRRLEKIDAGPSAHYRLAGVARKYQAAMSRRGQFKRRLRRMSNACHQRSVEIEERIKQLGGGELEEAVQSARQRLTDLEVVGRLRLCETELEQRQNALSGQLERLDGREPLPKWVYLILGFFAVAGAVSAAVGVVTGITANVIAGLMWALLGTTCGGLAWAIKTHFERADGEDLDRLQTEKDEIDVRLRETREAIARLAKGELAPVARAKSPAELIRETTQRFIELEQLTTTQRRIQARRRRLSELRGRFQGVQRELSAARQNWCEMLKQLGLPETVRIDEAFQTWERVIEAEEERRTWQAAVDELEGHRRTLHSFRRRLEELGRRLNGWEFSSDDPQDILAAWDERMAELTRNTAERRRLLREEKARRQEAAEYKERIDGLQMQRSALLVQGGATTRDEFEQRAEWVARSNELQELLEMAQAELDSAAASEPELAIVEEDLLAYDPAVNTERLQTLNGELEELERQLQRAFEQLGSLKQEIRSLEADRRPSALRFERTEVEGELRRAAERWFGLQLAARAVERLRADFERTCQPATLAAASHYLDRLTRGRYANIWTPLGERRLCIDDDSGRSFTVEQLSNGTREQLFLAIRLAMVRQFQEQGIELPMVLDDVIVNFDQHRTEAAIDTLTEFAAQGQQMLLFTCHLHLARLFEARGVPPVWLPGHQPAVEERRAG